MKRSPAIVRALVALIILAVALSVATFWPGTDHAPRLGLDLQGGTQVTLTPKSTTSEPITQEQLDQAVGIIRSRVNGLGVAEAEVTTQGSGTSAAIVVSVPGADQDSLVKLVGQTALLDFRPVFAPLNPAPVNPTLPTPAASPSVKTSASAKSGKSVKASPSPSVSGSAAPSAAPSVSDAAPVSPSASASTAAAPAKPAATSIVQAPENTPAFQEQAVALDCTNSKAFSGGTPDNPKQWLAACGRDGSTKYVMSPAFITGDMITGATASLSPNGGGWAVDLTFNEVGAQKLTQASQELTQLQDCSLGATPCNAFAIVLDGVVQSAPRFNQVISGGQAQISGQFTAQEAKDLASVLKYGALPVKLDIGEVTSISATVGADQLRAGLLAGGLGLLIVALYLLVYYRFLGLVAVASLAVSAGLVFTSLAVLSRTMGLTLTLAGVAGAIVAIGITADSFIVYFERLRDVTREGRSTRQAASEGWKSARRTILAADFISILAAVILYVVSIGSVRGFAFVLGLTTALDIIVAFWFTHPLTVLLTSWKPFASGAPWTGTSSLKSRPALADRLSPRGGSASSAPASLDKEGQSK